MRYLGIIPIAALTMLLFHSPGSQHTVLAGTWQLKLHPSQDPSS